MEYRKVQIANGRSMVVNLPLEYADHFGIKPGDIVRLDMTETGIFIRKVEAKDD